MLITYILGNTFNSWFNTVKLLPDSLSFCIIPVGLPELINSISDKTSSCTLSAPQIIHDMSRNGEKQGNRKPGDLIRSILTCIGKSHRNKEAEYLKDNIKKSPVLT